MCGIFGYTGASPCIERLYKGLSNLEYRGYDSAGICVFGRNGIEVVKESGKLANIQPALKGLDPQATVGMAHTRWATHGPPTRANAHPHTVDDRLAIIHNGIIENYVELREELQKVKGFKLLSSTDTEIALHVIKEQIDSGLDLQAALVRVLPRFKGAFAFVILDKREPSKIFVVKNGSPAVLGKGEGNDLYVASDALSFASYCNRVIFMHDGQMAVLDSGTGAVKLSDFQGNPVPAAWTPFNWTGLTIEKKGFKHFMLKEIVDQSQIFAQGSLRFFGPEGISLKEGVDGLDRLNLGKVKNIHLVACGTAYYASVVGRYLIERELGLMCNVELASEFRYREPPVGGDSLVIAVTQSGETADTLASVRYARSRGAQVLAVCNVMQSSIPRESDCVIYMQAGAEIGVCSTKAFTKMIFDLNAFVLYMAQERGLLARDRYGQLLDRLRPFPLLVDALVNAHDHVQEVAKKYAQARSMLYIGRGIHYPIALEGSLKLKEISYIHAEGYAGGELKHGPIALIDESMPVLALAPGDRHREKMISNVEEVAARGGQIIGIGHGDDSHFRSLCADFIEIPRIDDDALQAILSTVPLQLFSYFVAVSRGTDVDQPRNLAKSVTVE